MFEIQYSVSPNFESKNISNEPMDLRYDYMLGSITLRHCDSSIMMDWGWIPIYDFAICLVEICNKLLKGEQRQEFEFTESDAKILFGRRGIDMIKISTTFSNEEIEMSLLDFQNGIAGFYKSITSELK
jgi:hypothetical protein